MKIYKYPLKFQSVQLIEMPTGAEFLSAGFDPAGQFCIWCAVDPERPLDQYKFYIVMTGGDAPVGLHTTPRNHLWTGLLDTNTIGHLFARELAK